ncbi:MAG TPA: alpha/beta hydrolase-fold protein [Micromonosporaceae bacterium]|jgi:enterochelin esterase family protein
MVQAPTITLRYADDVRALDGVRLVQEFGKRSAALGLRDLEFSYDDASRTWSLRIPALPISRMEYRLELRRDGRPETVTDPANPLVAPGAFGDKSVLEMPGYRSPAWLDATVVAGTWTEQTIRSAALRRDIPVRIWTPHGLTSRGILLAHDGIEYDKLASLGRYSSAMIASGAMPPHDLVLLRPVERNDWYSANPAYAKALVTEVIPALPRLPIAALGASLGGLSLLHAHLRYPYTFGGLFLQSGSFFVNRYDGHESNFPPYQRIVRFVNGVRRRRRPDDRAPIVLTCGLGEENLSNNRAMASVLDAPLIEVPDAHNFVAWRDAWDPYLANLATAAWG